MQLSTRVAPEGQLEGVGADLPSPPALAAAAPETAAPGQTGADRKAGRQLTAAVKVAKQIAEALGETNIHQVRRVVEHLGAVVAQAHLVEAQRIEAAGGELVASGKRRRTPGGVFLRLVRDTATPEQRKAIGWPSGTGEPAPAGEPRARRSQTEPPPALPWAALAEHLPTLLKTPGATMSSKITLIGRPGRIIEAQGAVLTIMVSDPAKAPTLPKGLPVPPAQPTRYIVYIAQKQWQKVTEAIKDPADALIVEGYPVYDERLPGLAVLTQAITTRNLQRAKRESEAAPADGHTPKVAG